MVEPLDSHHCRAVELDGTVNDDRLVLAARHADVIGVDSPLGWPAAFVNAVSVHNALRPWPGATERATLTHRDTDRVVRSLGAGNPLSVSADKLGSVAMRCALLQRRWADEVWKIALILESNDRAEVERIAEAVARATCRVRHEQLTAVHECSTPWMLIQSRLDEDGARVWRADLSR
jgi:predicted nuclease with RNAse H fold